MVIIDNDINTCYALQEVEANKKYKIAFNIDNSFSLRFELRAIETEEHIYFLTRNLIGELGEYEYTFCPKYDGILYLYKKPNVRNNIWTKCYLTVEEVKDI